MNYYFKIAGITIRIESEIPVSWNSYIRAFLCEPTDEYEEYYQCICTDHLEPQGTVLYQGEWQVIYGHGGLEERLHYFYGQMQPCMLYRELEDRKVIELNRAYMDVFRGEENYCIFNAMAFEKVLMRRGAVVLHSSFIIWKDKAILFTAPSGTGKSTQAALWEKYAGAVIANGDRTILREVDGVIYACGMPICGSSDICRNVEVPVRAIVYLSQFTENIVYEMEIKERVKKLISETTINFFNREYVDMVFATLSRIAANIDMYHLFCTKDPEAVRVLEKKLEEKDGSN